MFKTRLEKIRRKLLKEKLDAVLVSDVANITYLSGYANFSVTEREAYIFIGKKFAYIITDARYTEEVRSKITHLELFERGHKNPMEELFKKYKIKKLGIEENNLTVAEHKFIKKLFKSTKHFELSRSIKTEEEVSKIEKACKLGDLAFDYVLNKIKAGVTEKEIADALENFIRSKGCVISFPSIVAFGRNSSVPHHQTGEAVLKEGEFALLDFGVKHENYCSDMTRAVFFGKPTTRQKKMYETVLKAQQKVVTAINSGELRAAKLYNIANDYIKSCGFPAIPHSLGHGIGLEVHEHLSLSPKSKEILKEGMVFSIEPGIYLPNFGGVRIEDLFVVKKDQLIQITHSPKQIISVKI